MMDDLMSDYDVIVVGTGMTESILASALSRIGKRVLHIDCNEYYGEDWASFNFDGIQNWIRRMNDYNNFECPHESEDNEVTKENEVIHRIKPKSNIWNIQEKWHCSLSTDDLKELVSCLDMGDKQKELGKNDEIHSAKESVTNEKFDEFFKNESRKFNLDLCPKVLFSRGPLVELLISSNIAKYAEFKSVSRVLTWRNNCLELVPCSRADVFSTKNITVVEKRLLVKILTLFLKYPENSEELNGFENKTFLEYLKYKKLPDNIIHYILYAMAMGDKSTSCVEGVKASKTFLESLGRYGNTPFIFPMYGSGELPQCFCRLCAVFGGVYCLKRGAEGIIRKDDKCVGIVSAKKRLNAEIFILSANYVPENVELKEENNKISRGIFITDRSILKSEKEPLTLLLFPPISNISENSVTVIELGPGTNTCPEKVFIVHMIARMTTDAASDLKHVVDALFQRENSCEEDGECERPKMLWSLTWNITQEICVSSPMENVKFCSGPSAELDFKFSIDEAKRIFKEICPDEEFLPRAPDPDEIVFETEGDSSEMGNGTAEEKASKELGHEKKQIMSSSAEETGGDDHLPESQPESHSHTVSGI